MKYVLAFCFVLLPFASVAQDKKPKLAELSILGDFVSVDGFWEPDNPNKQNEVTPTAIHMECNRHGGKEANLVKTEAFCVAATAMIGPGGIGLIAGLIWYGVTSWSDTEIVISDDSPICITSKTFFDLKRKTVTGLDIRKPEAVGFAGSCKALPDRQSYYLRDAIDYALFHA